MYSFNLIFIDFIDFFKIKIFQFLFPGDELSDNHRRQHAFTQRIFLGHSGIQSSFLLLDPTITFLFQFSNKKYIINVVSLVPLNNVNT